MGWRYGIHSLILLIAASLCIVQAARIMGAAEAMVGCDVEYRVTDESVSFDAVERLRDAIADDSEANTGEVCAYAQAQAQTIETEDKAASIRVDILWMDGYAPRAWNVSTIRGLLPQFGREAVCAMDKKTAAQLFGSSDVIGKTVRVNEAEFTLCAVFELPDGGAVWGSDPGRGVVFCPAAFDEEARIEAYAFSAVKDAGSPPVEQAERWLQAAGLSVPELCVNHPERRVVATLFQQAFRLLLMLWAFCALGQTALSSFRHAKNTSDLSRIWIGIVSLAVLGAALYMLRFSLKIPPNYLPTRWSDLNYWPRLIESIGQTDAQWAMASALRPMLARSALERTASLTYSAALILTILAWRAQRRASRMIGKYF